MIGGSDDFVWIGGPDEGLWLLVVVGDECQYSNHAFGAAFFSGE